MNHVVLYLVNGNKIIDSNFIPCTIPQHLHTELELAKIQAKKESLESQVRQQNISPEEVTKMNNEQTNLKTSIARHQHELADIKRKVGEEEMSIARKQDELEKLLEQYKTLGQNIHTIGSNRTLAPPHITSYLSDPSIREVNFDLDVQSDGMASAGSDLTSVGKETERMRHQIRPALQKYSELVNMDLQKRKTEEIQVKAEWDTLSAQVGMRNQQAKTLELKVDLKNREVEKVWAVSVAELSKSLLSWAAIQRIFGILCILTGNVCDLFGFLL